MILLVSLTSVKAQTNIQSTMHHRGQSRSYIVHLPAGFSTAVPVPLVIGLHPGFSSAATFQSTSGWDAKSDAEGFVVVYPDGGQVSGDGRFNWNSYDFSGSDPDDLGYLSALIDRVAADYSIDLSRVYMTGFSNGAMMTNSFAAAHSGRVAAIAPVSGGWITAYGGNEAQMQPSRAVPTWIWRGSNETFTTGVGAFAKPRSEQDQEQKSFWIANNNAVFNSTIMEQLSYPLPRTYNTEQYIGQAPVWFTEVSGSSHVYQPGAADLIWDRFFSQMVVPEPASGLLVFVGAMILLNRRHRSGVRAAEQATFARTVT